MNSETSVDDGDFTLITQEVTYVVMLLNTNERFLEMTFEVLQKYQNLQKKKNRKFGCSIFVFPKLNYIYKSISNMQPMKVQDAVKKVHNFNFEFLPIDENVISLELNDIIRDLFIKNDKEVYQILAGYLYKINFIFGKINDYVYRGHLSQKVIEYFVKSVWLSEIGNDSEESKFDEIREWANREFAVYEDNVDDAKELEKQYRLDGKSVNVNKKISESYLIDVPRDDSGNIVREEVKKMMNRKKEEKDYKKNNIGKRKTFFHFKGTIDIRNFSKVFMKSHQNSKKNSVVTKEPVPEKKPIKIPGNKISTKEMKKFKIEQNKRLKAKYKVDFEIKEESLNPSNFNSKKGSSRHASKLLASNVEKSFDSHSDSDEFDPNAGMFSDNSDITESNLSLIHI